VDIQLKNAKNRLAKQGISITIDESLKKHLAEVGFSSEYGARPVKRTIQKLVLDQLADAIIKGELKNAKKIKIGFNKSMGVALSIGA